MKNRYKERVCPVCRKLEKIPEGEICLDCSNEILELKKIKKEYETKTGEIFFINNKPIHLDTIKDISGTYSSFRWEYINNIQALLNKLVINLTLPVENEKKTYKHTPENVIGGYFGITEHRYGYKGFKEDVENLQVDIKKQLQQAYDEGVKDGKNLLINFASGNITIDEMNFSTINRKKC